MYQLILKANSVLWGMFGVSLLILLFGIFATIGLRFPWIWLFKDMIGAYKGKASNAGASPFATLCASLGGQVGTGNLIGVSTAIASGGPGALFWMCITALVGMSTIVVETILAQLYKEQNDDSTYRGGAAYYIGNGLHQRWLGIIVAFIIAIGSGIANAMSHVNAIYSAVNTVIPCNPVVIGTILSVAAFVIVIGGFKRVSGFASKVVPVMALAYIAIALFVIITNITKVPAMFQMILSSAFSTRAAVGGVVGYTVSKAFRYGMARGIFSNEAGQGSTPHTTASGSPMHPVTQGFLGSMAVAVDTLLICSATGIIILLSGADYTELSGASLTQAAFSQFFGGTAPIIVALQHFFFGFTSLVASFYGGNVNVGYICNNKNVRLIYMVILTILSSLSAILSVDAMFEISDFVSALMVFPNIIALVFLFKQASACLKDYEEQRARGIEVPVFDWNKFRKEQGMKPFDE